MGESKVKVIHSKKASLNEKPSYLLDLEKKWRTWTNIDEPEAYEALRDLSGDLWGELRKLEAILCKEIENRELPEDFKEFSKARIRDVWRDIIGHQKIGLDKLCIVIRKHIHTKD